jgi:hypothetical protein
VLPPVGFEKRRRDLDQALQQEPPRAGSAQPLDFPGVVRLEEPPGIEEPTARLEPAGWRLVSR